MCPVYTQDNGCFVAQLFLTLCDPMACSPPGSSVHGHSPGNNIAVSCHALLQGIFPTQGSDPGLPHWRQILYCLSHKGSPYKNSRSSLKNKKILTHAKTRMKPEASLVAQMVKNLPGVQETWVWSLGREDPLKKGMATHPNIIAWRTAWTEKTGRL